MWDVVTIIYYCNFVQNTGLNKCSADISLKRPLQDLRHMMYIQISNNEVAGTEGSSEVQEEINPKFNSNDT